MRNAHTGVMLATIFKTQGNEMRKILFRGYDGHRWKYGLLEMVFGEYHILQNHILHKVNQNSVGQFTGLKDKNGKDIYEGDILEIKVSYDYETSHIRFAVEYDEVIGAFVDDLDGNLVSDYRNYEIIGNVYENEELLKHEIE